MVHTFAMFSSDGYTEVVAAYRKAIMSTSIYRHASDYMRVNNWHMLYVYVSLHEEVYLFFQINDVEVRAINELNKFIFQLKKNHP